MKQRQGCVGKDKRPPPQARKKNNKRNRLLQRLRRLFSLCSSFRYRALAIITPLLSKNNASPPRCSNKKRVHLKSVQYDPSGWRKQYNSRVDDSSYDLYKKDFSQRRWPLKKKPPLNDPPRRVIFHSLAAVEKAAVTITAEAIRTPIEALMPCLTLTSNTGIYLYRYSYSWADAGDIKKIVLPRGQYLRPLSHQVASKRTASICSAGPGSDSPRAVASAQSGPLMHHSVVRQIRVQGPVQQLKQAQAATLSVTTPELRVHVKGFDGHRCFYRGFFRSNSEPLTSNGKHSITDNSALSDEVFSDTELLILKPDEPVRAVKKRSFCRPISRGTLCSADKSLLNEMWPDAEPVLLEKIMAILAQSMTSVKYKQYTEALVLDLPYNPKTSSNLAYICGARCSRIE